MARSKVKKHAKATTKKTAKNQNNSLFLADKMGKDFRALPAQIATQYRKELLVLKEQEKKLMEAVKKAQAQAAAAMNKHHAIAARPVTVASKKQLKTAKISCDKANKLLSALTKNLETAKKHTLVAVEKQTIFSTINKDFSNFIKQIEAKAKKPIATKKKPSKTMKKEVPSTMTTTDISKEQELPMSMSDHESTMTES